MKPQLKLLWFDDRIDELDSLVADLSGAGFAVTACASGSVAVNHAKRQRYDLVLGDIRLVESDKVENGIHFLRDIHQIQPEAKYAVLSSYLYLHEYIDLLNKQLFPIYIIEKFVGLDDETSINEQLIIPLRTVAETGGGTTITDVKKAIGAAAGEDPFQLRLNEFLGRTQIERQSLTRRVRELASSTLKRQFEEGYVWVLLCGNSTDVRARSKRVDGILKEERVWELAKAYDAPPYQFMAHLDVGEFSWSTECEISKDVYSYPTVTLELGGRRMTLHFDTGAQTTLFSYEKLTDLSVIRPQQLTINTPINGRDYESSAFTIPGVLHSQDGIQSVPIQLCGIALLDWVTTRFAKPCANKCPLAVGDGICRFREGLVGRSLLNGQPMKLLLDGVNKMTIIVQ